MKKLLSVVLSIVMVLGMVMPMGVMAEETTEKDWIEFEGNSTIFMPYDTTEGSDYSNRVNLTNYVPGLDYGSAVQTPIGDFATDKSKVSTSVNMGAFVYTKDSTQAPDRYTVADFKTGADGKLYWNIDGVDYLVNPEQKAIKVVKGHNLAELVIKGKSEDNYALAADYSTLEKFTLDVEDGRYESISFLAGITNNYTRKLYVELEYDNKIENKEINVVGEKPSSNRTYKNGSTYFHKMNSATVDNATKDYNTFKPYTVEVDKNATLKRVIIKPTQLTSTGGSGTSFYPVYIISAWRDVRTQAEVFADLEALVAAGVKTEDDLKNIKSAIAFIDEKYEALTDAQQTVYNNAKAVAAAGEYTANKNKAINEKYINYDFKPMFDMFATGKDFLQAGWYDGTENAPIDPENILAFKGHANRSYSCAQPLNVNSCAFKTDELLGLSNVTYSDGHYTITVGGVPFKLGDIAREANQHGGNAWQIRATYNPSAYTGDITLPALPTEGDVAYSGTNNTSTGTFQVNKAGLSSMNLIMTNTSRVKTSNRLFHVAVKYEGENEQKGYIVSGSPIQTAMQNIYAVKVSDYNATKGSTATDKEKYAALNTAAVSLESIMPEADLTKLSAIGATKPIVIPTSSTPFAPLYLRSTWSSTFNSHIQNVSYPLDSSKKVEYVKIIGNLAIDVQSLTETSGGFYDSGSYVGNLMLNYDGNPVIKVGEEEYMLYLQLIRECTDGILFGMTFEKEETYAEKIAKVNEDIEKLTTEATVEEFTAIENEIETLKVESEYIEDSDFNLAKLNEIKRIINAELNAHKVIKVGKVTQFPLSAATGANSRLFVEKGKESQIAESGYIEGVDFHGRLADSKAAETQYFIPFSYYDGTNTQKGLIFKKDEKGSYVEFTYYGGETKKFYVNPEEKVIKVTKVDAKEEYYGANVAAAATLNATTIDVPDGKYDSISYLAGCTYRRTPEITFIYEDESVPATNIEQVVEWSHANYRGASGTESYSYYTTWDDTTMAQRSIARFYFVSDLKASTAYIGYKEFTVTPDPTKVLKAIKFSEDAYGSPISIISLWGSNKTIEEKLAELDAIEITNAEELVAAKQAIADFDAYLADLGYELIDLGSFKAPYTALQTRIAEYEANADRLNALYAGERYTPVKLKIAEGKSAEGLVYGFEDPAYRIMSNTEENAAIYNIVKDKKYVSTRLLKDESYVPQTVAHWQQYDTTHTGLPTGIQFYSKELLNDKNEYTTPAGAKYVVNTFGDTDYNSAYLKLSTADNFVAEFDGVTPYNSVKLLLSAVDEPIWNGSGRNARAVTATINYADGTSEKKLVFIGSLYGYGAALSAKLKDSAEIRGHGLNTSLLANEKNINTAVDATGKVTTKAKTSAIYTNLTSGNISAAGKTTWSPFDYAENIWAEGMFYSSAYANTGSNAATQADRKAYILKKMTDGAGHFTSVTLDTKGKAVTSVTIGAVANDSHFDELCGESGAFRYSGDTNSMYYRVPISDEAAKELLAGKSAPFGTLYKFDETGAVETETQTVNGTDYQIAKGYSNYTVEDCDVYLTVHAQASAHFVVLHAATGEKTYANVMERIEDANTKMREITVNSSYEEAKAIDELYKSTLALEIVREEDFDEAAVANFNIVYKAIRDKTNVSGKVEVLYYKGEAPEVKVEINNITTDAGKPYSVILAYYDAEGNYIASHIENRKSTASEKESFSITDENCPSNTMKVKAFLWKDFETLIPLADAADSEVRTSLKVLAIGNSYSDDAQTYLTEIAQNAGLTDVIIGNAYIGGCSLSTHKGNIDSNKVAYWFRHKTIDEQGKIVKTSSGTKVEGSSSTLADKTLLECITAEDWDIITIQQASASSAKADTYGSLQSIIDYVNEHKTNKNAKIGWHMTWAYTDNSTTLAERYPGMTQMDMYNGISNAVQTQVLPLEDISFVIPAGTAVQNARVPLGDTLIGSDNVHLNALGDYVAGLTWFAKLTGMSIDNITYTPNTDIANKLDTIKKAVKDAIANPYTVTK